MSKEPKEPPLLLLAELLRHRREIVRIVGEALRLRRVVTESGVCEAGDDLLVAGHRDRGEHQVGFEGADVGDPDVEVAADLGQWSDHVGWPVGVVVDADQKELSAMIETFVARRTLEL